MTQYEINISQSRTAYGDDYSAATNIYAVRWTNDYMVTLSEDVERDFCGVPSDAYQVAATVTLHHPALMMGTEEEIRDAFYRIVYDKLEQEGLLVITNGTLLWRD